MQKYDAFKKEIEYIKNDLYKENIKIMLNLLPDYFYEIPASSTGKYHPNFALNKGGLVRHTKVACRIAYELLNNNIIGNIFNDREKDLIIMALMIHDGLKEGIIKEQYTAFDHPLIIAKFIKDNKNKLNMEEKDIDFIASLVETHMGEWNTNPYSDVVLPIPSNRYQKLVHMCDFLASRKFIDVEFEDGNIKY